MAQSDGSVIIDTKLDTSGINKGAANMEEQMEKMAVAAETTAMDIASSFSDIDFTNVADGMSESFSKESSEIEAILSNNEKSAKSKAASIAAVYKKQGLSQSDAMKKAWELIERNSKTSSEKVEKTSKSSSKKIQKHIADIGTKSKNVGKSVTSNLSNGISSVVKKIGVAIASAFAVRTIINFGKEALELGSDLQEVQNVVDVTFTTMSDKVDEFAKNAAASAGLSETMAKKFAGTFGAMSKSFGFAESEAFDMSVALTQLSGDVASFYNLTQEEAYTKLKSVFTGETETLKDLGVVMTQSALDSFAMAKGYKKTTKAMSEQEKVALRYEFVMDQLSGASGDFLRTSDGWANQVRVLKLNVESFMATIGQGLINLLTPAIKLLNSLFVSLQKVANGFKEWTEEITGKDSVSEEMSGAASGAGNIASDMKDAAAMSKKLKQNLSGLDEIKVFDSGEDSVEELESVVGSIGDLSGSDLTVGVGGDGGSLFDPKTILKNIAEGIGEMDFGVLGGKVSSAVVKGLESVNNVIDNIPWKGIGEKINFFISSASWGDIGREVGSTAASLLEGGADFVDEIGWENVGTAIADAVKGIPWETVLKSAGKLVFNLTEATVTLAGTLLNELVIQPIGGTIEDILSDIADYVFEIMKQNAGGLFNAGTTENPKERAFYEKMTREEFSAFLRQEQMLKETLKDPSFRLFDELEKMGIEDFYQKENYLEAIEKGVSVKVNEMAKKLMEGLSEEQRQDIEKDLLAALDKVAPSNWEQVIKFLQTSQSKTKDADKWFDTLSKFIKGDIISSLSDIASSADKVIDQVKDAREELEKQPMPIIPGGSSSQTDTKLDIVSDIDPKRIELLVDEISKKLPENIRESYKKQLYNALISLSSDAEVGIVARDLTEAWASHAQPQAFATYVQKLLANNGSGIRSLLEETGREDANIYTDSFLIEVDKVDSGLPGDFPTRTEEIADLGKKSGETFANSAKGQMQLLPQSAANIGYDAGTKVGQNLSTGLDAKKSAVAASGHGLLDSALTDSGVVALKGEMHQAGSDGGQNLSVGLDGKKGAVAASGQGLLDSALTDIGVTTLNNEMLQTGSGAGQKLADGMDGKKETVKASAKALFEKAISKTDIDTTKRTLFEAGDGAGQNLADGLNGKKLTVSAKGKELLNSILTDADTVSVKGAMYQAGSDAGQDLADGLDSKKPIFKASGAGAIGTMSSGIETEAKGNTVKSALTRAISSIASTIMTTFDNDMRNTGEKQAKEIGEKVGKAYAGGLGNTATSGVQSIVSKGLSKIGETLKDLTTIEVGGVKPFSFATSILTKFNVPLLAKGAVIPPNAPFAAILGEQPRGTNVEAPLDTIKQAMREVLGEGGQKGGNTYNVTATARGRAVFELVISEARAELARTGKSPFELVKS